MNKNDLDKLRNLLGPQFTEGELAKLLQEDPDLVASAEKLSHLFQKARNEPIPPLSRDFTRRTMDRIMAPSLWQTIQEKFFNLRALSLAGSLALILLAAMIFLPRFFPATTFPGLALREEKGAGQENIFYVRFAVKNPKARSVSVAGDFNQWSEVPLVLADAGQGLYTVEVAIPRGTYAYAFLVDGKKWIADPTADRVIDDGFGNKNSLMNL